MRKIRNLTSVFTHKNPIIPTPKFNSLSQQGIAKSPHFKKQEVIWSSLSSTTSSNSKKASTSTERGMVSPTRSFFVNFEQVHCKKQFILYILIKQLAAKNDWCGKYFDNQQVTLVYRFQPRRFMGFRKKNLSEKSVGLLKLKHKKSATQ